LGEGGASFSKVAWEEEREILGELVGKP